MPRKSKKKSKPLKLDELQLEQLKKLEKEFVDFCMIHELPCFVTAVVENGESSTEYLSQAGNGKKYEEISRVYSGTSHYIGLADDHIRKHILVCCGMDENDNRSGEMIGDAFSEDDMDLFGL